MTPLHWTWVAVMGDLGLIFSPLVTSTSMGAFALVLLTHTVVGTVVALSSYLMLPQRFRHPRLAVTALMFSFAFMAPVIGALGLLYLIRTQLRQTLAQVQRAVPQAVQLPVYDVQTKGTSRGSQGAIRSRLGHEVPASLRMQSLLTLQAVPSRVSNPILEDLLGDDSDDVRLVAFGMLDSEEKKISSRIREASLRLPTLGAAEQRFECLRQLAELHWELVYACLAQGELRQHMLVQAARYADEALALGVAAGSGLIFLRGRIWLEQGQLDTAQQAMEQALALGQAKTSVWPYLAEIAFRRRDFGRVRDIMQQLSGLNLSSRTRAVEDFWIRRDRETNISDHRFLSHI